VANQVAIALEGTLLLERAETDREYLSMLMSAVDDAVWLVDTNLKVVAQNEAAGEMVGCSTSEAIGRSIYDLSFADTDSLHKLGQLFRQAIEEGQPVVVDQSILLTAKESSFSFVGGKVVPIVRGDHVVGALCAFQKPSVDKSDKQVRLEFANMASHLLRTPLSFIQTSIDLMMNSELDVEEQRIMLDKMWERSQHLTEFTDELLEILRIEMGDIHTYVEPVSLLPLVEKVMNLVQYEANGHQFNLVAPDTLPAVAADTTKTELVLFNLLTNAVNRCPLGGRIIVELEVGKTEVNTSIIDEGECIPEKLLDRVFGQFYPVDDENGKMPSTYQLGLFTTKRLVELQNGHVWAKSRPDQGSRFSFSLPIWEK
jgi:PAS domain S-box-containing protein